MQETVRAVRRDRQIQKRGWTLAAKRMVTKSMAAGERIKLAVIIAKGCHENMEARRSPFCLSKTMISTPRNRTIPVHVALVLYVNRPKKKMQKKR